MRGLFSQDDQLSSRELTEISCGLTILSFTVLILLYTFVVLCCTFYERNLRCGRTLGIHLPTGSPRYTGITHCPSGKLQKNGSFAISDAMSTCWMKESQICGNTTSLWSSRKMHELLAEYNE